MAGKRQDFSGKVAVVTGAGSGLGRALALDLAARGARLAISDVNPDGLGETRAELQAGGADVFAQRVDISDRAQVDAHAKAVRDHFGQVHQLYNNAGRAIGAKPIAKTPDKDFSDTLDVNLWGVFYATRAFLPMLIDSGAGCLCNISSINGSVALGQATAYCASKFAVKGLTEAVQVEMLTARAPVHVALVMPGGIATNIARGLPENFDDLPPKRQAEIRAAIDHHYATMLKMPPEVAAKIILDRLARGKSRITVTPRAFWLDILVRLLPGRYPGLVAGFQRRN